MTSHTNLHPNCHLDIIIEENLNSFIQCWGSVTFWSGSGTPDLYLWLMDSDPAPDSDPTQDPTTFFNDIIDVKKKFIFFLVTYPKVHHLQSKKLIFLLTFCVKIPFCQAFSSPLNTFMGKGKDPDPYL